MLGVGDFCAFLPGLDAGGPVLEGFGGVTGDVELFVAVEAGVDEVGGEVFEEGPFSGGVGDDEGYVVFSEEGDEFGGFEGVVADFDGVAEGTFWGGIEIRAAFHEVGVLGGEFGGGVGVVGELLEEGIEKIGVEFEGWGELPEDGTELFVEGEEALGEEVGEGFFDLFEAFDVGDVAGGFDGEKEVGRRFVVPGLPGGGALKGVEGAIEFDGVELGARRRRVHFFAPGLLGRRCRAKADSASRRCRCGGRAWGDSEE